ncbi:MAG: DNA-binding protein [Candidatus Bathyarchaeia archaeon]
MSEEDVELERLKQQRLMNMQQQRVAQEEAKARAEAEKQGVLRLVLTPEARQRLMNIRIVKPEFAEQLELQLIQLAQTGKVPVPITDDYLRIILDKLTSKKRDISIRRI